MDVRAALAACGSTAEIYRVQIDAENCLAPAEVAALAADHASLPEAAQPWILKLAATCAGICATTQPYRRRDLGDNAMMFEAPAPADAPRSLVVAFTGIALRMMLPVAGFLQALPAERCDVLVLRDPDRVCFLQGVPGYAPDIRALASRLAADLPMDRYTDRCCVGTSSGGAAALVLGPLIGARVALALGGGHPHALTQRAPPGTDRAAFDTLLAAPPQPTRRICAFGDGFPRDGVRARLLAMMCHADLLEVRGVGVHGVLTGLAARKSMARFLWDVLLGDAPPGPAWPA
jgi:hypothetical protein